MAQLSSCLGTYIFGRNSATAIVAEPGRQSHASRERYDKDVYNGDLGVVLRIDMEESELTVDFDSREVVYGFGELDELVLAYATTIHKSQGSEYPAVLIPADDAALSDAATEPSLHRGDARQAPRSARRAAEGARYCG
jgi:hypothetical protein